MKLLNDGDVVVYPACSHYFRVMLLKIYIVVEDPFDTPDYSALACAGITSTVILLERKNIAHLM